MIWRLREEGGRLRYGVNWRRSERSHLEVALSWRGISHHYVTGIRLRRRQFGPMWIWRGVHRFCLYCDVRLDLTCARCWRARRAA